jgi:hypothetical protein
MILRRRISALITVRIRCENAGLTALEQLGTAAIPGWETVVLF